MEQKKQSDGQAGKWITKELLKTKEGWTKFHGLHKLIIIRNSRSVLVLQVLGPKKVQLYIVIHLTTEANGRQCLAMGHFKRPRSDQHDARGGGWPV